MTDPWDHRTEDEIRREVMRRGVPGRNRKERRATLKAQGQRVMRKMIFGRKH
jgi:hypothetical protein